MSLKDEVINNLINMEILGNKVYTDNPNDSGGKTSFGITEKTATLYGYTGDMRLLSRSIAFNIYKQKYWDKIEGDKLSSLSENLTKRIMNAGINTGIKRASLWLQRSLNVLNDRERLYPDIKVDGSIGENTIKSLSLYLSVRDEDVLEEVFLCLQGEYYISIAEEKEKNEEFEYGWFKKRILS